MKLYFRDLIHFVLYRIVNCCAVMAEAPHEDALNTLMELQDSFNERIQERLSDGQALPKRRKLMHQNDGLTEEREEQERTMASVGAIISMHFSVAVVYETVLNLHEMRNQIEQQVIHNNKWHLNTSAYSRIFTYLKSILYLVL